MRKIIGLAVLLFILLVTAVTVYQVRKQQLFEQKAFGCLLQADGTLLCRDYGCTEDAQCAFGRYCADRRCVLDTNPQPTTPGTLTTETGKDCLDPAGGYGWGEYCNKDRCHWGCSEINCGGGVCIVPTPIPSGMSYTEGSHMECVNNRCAKIERSGINESGCLPGSQTTSCGYTHMDCIGGKCVMSAPGAYGDGGNTGSCMREGSSCSGGGMLLLACDIQNKSSCQSMTVANPCDCQCVRPGFSCAGCTETNVVCPTAKPGPTGNENLSIGGSVISTPTPIPAGASSRGCMNGDVNGDGVVNIIDIGIIIDNYDK